MQTKKPPKNPHHNYVKYSALAFQTGIIMFGLAYAGIRLDKYLALTTPIFTLVLSILGIVLAMYLLLKDLMKPKK